VTLAIVEQYDFSWYEDILGSGYIGMVNATELTLENFKRPKLIVDDFMICVRVGLFFRTVPVPVTF